MASSSGSFYELLGVEPTATPAEIRQGYLRAAQEYHPDRNRDDSHTDRRFKQIRRVYEILHDPVVRATYDEDPTRFRLNDTGVVMVGSETIITQPRPWSTEPQRHTTRADTFQPQATIARYRVENIWIFLGGLVAMTGLIAASVLAVRQHRSDIDEYAARQKRQPTFNEPTVTPPELLPSLDVVVEPMDAIQATPETTKADTTKEPQHPVESSLPELNVIDRVNSGEPDWPDLPRPPSLDAGPITSFEPPSTWDPASAVPTVKPMVPKKIETPKRLLQGTEPLPPVGSSDITPLPPPLTNDQELHRMNARIVIEQARQRSQSRFLHGPNQVGQPLTPTERSPVPSGIMDPDFTNRFPLFPPSSENAMATASSWRPSGIETRPFGASASLIPSTQLQHGPLRRAYAELAPHYDHMEYANPGNSWQPTSGYHHPLNTAARSTVRPLVGTPLRSPGTIVGGSRPPTGSNGVLRSLVTPPSLLP